MMEIQYFAFNPFQENTYLLINEKKDCIIIDPGCYFQEERTELLQYIEKEGLNVTRLLNTHCHLDHIFGNRLVAKTYNVGLEIHRLEQVVLDRSPRRALCIMYPLSPPRNRFVIWKKGKRSSLGKRSWKCCSPPDTLPAAFPSIMQPGSL